MIFLGIEAEEWIEVYSLLKQRSTSRSPKEALALILNQLDLAEAQAATAEKRTWEAAAYWCRDKRAEFGNLMGPKPSDESLAVATWMGMASSEFLKMARAAEARQGAKR